MEKLLRDKKLILLFVGPALLMYLLIMLFPILDSLYISMSKWDILSPMKYVGFQNFIRMFTVDDLFPLALKNVCIILVASLVGEQVFGFFTAAALTAEIRFKNVFKNIYFMPAVLSSAAVGLMWSFIYNPRVGLVNSLLRAIGLDSLTRQWLSDEKIALWAICVVVVWQYTGYSMTLFMSAIQGIPTSLFESARIDGATPLRILRHITLPLIMPIVKINTVLISVGSLKFFDLVFTMTPNGGPAHATEVLASHIYTRAFTNFEYGFGDALSVVLLLLCLLLTLIINKAFRIEKIEY